MKVEKFWQHWSALWATSRQANKKTLAHGCEFWGFDDGKRHRELLLYHPCDVDDYVSKLQLDHPQDFLYLSGTSLIPANFRYCDTLAMMTKDNLYHQKIVKPNFLQIKQFYIGDTFTIHLCDRDGLVARGQMVCDGGYALFDRIFVDDSYRRQGLATCVMQLLQNHATHQGATTGLLVATQMGKQLYQHLHWQHLADCQMLQRCFSH